ncbi:variable surface lipoprotein [Mycoplasmopsis agalactiae]|uniref:variable surface lipoprotein n=1 Tax=Mycoplasmopsis agalactiae TaxID=2110 RepID=UPI00280B5625|nr:variable surface lipoprotein [Mycoplasmopsis agalactiae]
MKKSKFLLLGSLSSLAAIPFVAAKCDDTKDESKKPAETPGKDQKDPKAPADDKMPADKDKDQKDKEDKTGGNTSTDKKDPKEPGGDRSTTPPADDPNATPAAPRKEDQKLDELKKETKEIIESLEGYVAEIKKAKFDMSKFESFKKENKDLDYVSGLNENTFPVLVNDFTTQLTEFIEGLKETLEDMSKEDGWTKEDIDAVKEQNKEISDIVKKQLEVFKKISK